MPRSQFRVATTSFGSESDAVVRRSMVGTKSAGGDEGVRVIWVADNTEMGSDDER